MNAIVASTIAILILSLIFLIICYNVARHFTSLTRATVSTIISIVYFITALYVGREAGLRADPYFDEDRLLRHCVRLALASAIVISAASILA